MKSSEELGEPSNKAQSSAELQNTMRKPCELFARKLRAFRSGAAPTGAGWPVTNSQLSLAPDFLDSAARFSRVRLALSDGAARGKS